MDNRLPHASLMNTNKLKEYAVKNITNFDSSINLDSNLAELLYCLGVSLSQLMVN